MRRFVLGWKTLGYAQHFCAEIVNFADDLCVLGKAPAAEMLTAVERLMGGLKLTVNEQKTRCLRCPEEPIEFLGYRIGRNYRPHGKGAYIGTRPGKASVQSICRKISEMTAPQHGWKSMEEMVEGLNCTMSGWANYFSLGQVSPAYNAVNRHTGKRLRQWLGRKHKTRAGRFVRYSEESGNRSWPRRAATATTTVRSYWRSRPSCAAAEPPRSSPTTTPRRLHTGGAIFVPVSTTRRFPMSTVQNAVTAEADNSSATIHARVGASAIDKVTRLFSASLADIFTETLQNSRRGGANRVAATIEQDGDITRVTLADDGVGIADPAILLTFGESNWKDGIAEAEDPAGFGLLALSRRGCTLRWRVPGGDPSPGYRLVLEPAHFLGRDAAHVVPDDSAPSPHGTAVTFEASEAPHSVRAFLETAARHYPLPVKPADETVRVPDPVREGFPLLRRHGQHFVYFGEGA